MVTTNILINSRKNSTFKTTRSYRKKRKFQNSEKNTILEGEDEISNMSQFLGDNSSNDLVCLSLDDTDIHR